MIDVDEVTVRFDDVLAISDVSLTVDDHEFLTIIGPSGCGKTTLLRTIGGLEAPTSGAVTINDRPPAAAQTAGDIGFVFQEHTLFPWKSAIDNVVLLRNMAGKPENREAARSLLRTIGLEGFEDSVPRELSGGMRQRVAIARALHLDADALLMDEPFGELDEITRDRLALEVLSLWREQRKTVVFITHSVPEAVFLADRCVIMRDDPGRIDRTIEIDLPRPRDESVFDSEDFLSTVASVRRAIHRED